MSQATLIQDPARIGRTPSFCHQQAPAHVTRIPYDDVAGLDRDLAPRLVPL